MAINRKAKAPQYPQGQPGSPGTRYAPSSRKQPTPTGMSPSDPSYGTMTSGSGGDLVGKGSRWSATNRNIPDNQDQLEGKVPRSFCK
jgi:hypothetical protein